ncbi:MAG: hypothetical protein Pg6C_17120 [Treponemataceae bacterium]|nr:MAG: hypothetical protein Pg6C_17120 [Treponemataceae bacterium]
MAAYASVKVGLDAGDLYVTGARIVATFKEIDRAIAEAEKEKNVDLAGRLAYEKDKLQGATFGFQQDVKTFTGSAKYQEYAALKADGKDVSKFTADQSFMSALKSMEESNKALKETMDRLCEAAAKGDFEAVQAANKAAIQEMNRFHQAAGQAAEPEGGAGKAALATFMNVQTAQQIIGAVESGIKTYVAHLDRSSIINQQGSGNIVGAEIEELHRSAAEASQFWGTLGRIGGGILGGVAGFFIGGGPMGAAGGAALGSSLLGSAGDLVGTLGDEKKANEMATREAYSQLWERQAPAAMELAGLLGRYGRGETREEIEANNTRAIRDSFSAAAGAANEYGYSAQEGMEAVKQGARQGLGEGDAVAAAKKAFAFERGTGADRDALLELETRGRRFGMDNMIGAAWQGNQASGMSTGQFNEFLRSMQRVFEDGISKGFVRGANEIAGNLTYLAELSGGSALYKGEEGAKIMQSLSGGIEGATSLSSVNDILTYRAAQSVIDQWKNSDDESQRQKYRDLFDLDPSIAGYEAGDPAKASSWYAATLLMNRGFTPEVFNQQMRNFGTADRGDFDNIIGRIMSQYGMNSAQAGFLYNAWKKNNGSATLADYRRAMTIQSTEAPASGSEELTYEKLTQAFSTTLAEYGQGAFNVKVKELPDLIEKQKDRLSAFGTHDYEPGVASGTDDSELFDQNNIELQYSRTEYAGKGFFSKNEADDERNFKSFLSAAIGSGDAARIKQATSVMDYLVNAPDDIKKEWNENNTLNAMLANSNNISDLLNEIRSMHSTLKEKQQDVNVTVHQE